MNLFLRSITCFIIILFFSPCSFAQVNSQQVQNFNTKQASKFTENKGQITDQNGNLRTDVKYIYNAPGFKAIFKDNSFSYEVYTVEKKPKQVSEATGKPVDDLLNDNFRQPEDVTIKSHRIDINLPGANKHPEIIVEGKGADYNNYLAHSPEQGVQRVYSYTKLTYKNIWPKVDIVFYAEKEGALKYDMVVHPGGKLENIKMKYDGVGGLALAEGELKVNTAFGEIEEDIPYSFLYENKEGVLVKHLLKDNYISFTCNYDKSKTLVVDPQLLWGTYYGGSDDEQGRGISTDASGNVYITGITLSASGIATTGAHQSAYFAKGTAFLAKLNSSGVRQWGTYYSGNANAYGYGVSTDKNGNVFIIGYSYSSTGIATTGAHQTSAGGSSDAYLAKFNSSGAIQWGTYYGGSGEEYGRSVTTDDSGNVYITGYTNSNTTSAIASSGAYQTAFGGWYDVFVAKFNNNGIRKWGTYFGGSGSDRAHGISTDGSANVYITGFAASITGIATSNAHQTTYGGTTDAFLVKFSSNGVRQWSTYYGDNGGEIGNSLITDSNSNIYMIGYTGSTSTIATTGAHQASIGGLDDAFLVKFDSTGKRLWGTYYGGSSNDYANSIAIDGWGNIFMIGNTSSTSDIAIGGTYQTTNGGGNDGFIVKFSSAGTRQWGTYYGGSSDDYGQDISIQGCNTLFITGYTGSTSDISTTGAHQVSNGGANDAFIAKILDNSGISATLIGDSVVCSGSIQSYFVKKVIGLNYSWTVYGGTIISGQNTDSISVAWGSKGVGKIRLVVELSSLKCKDSVLYYVNVNQLPTANTGNDTSICNGASISLSAVAITGNNYSWRSKPIGFTSSVANPLVRPLTTTTFYLTETLPTGCSKTDSITITVHQLPKAAFSVKNACIGSVVSVSDSAIDAKNYIWHFGDGSKYTSQNPSHVYNTTGNFTISQVVYSLNGCKDSTSKQIIVYNKPNSSITGDSFVCPTSVTYFKSKAAAGYAWSVTGGSIQSGQNSDSIMVMWNKVGKGTVKLVNANGSGCKDSSFLTIKIDSTACDWVWPGDANADKVVDNKDILAIGVAYSDTGSSRADTSTAWKAHLVKDWSKNFLSGANDKHADSDGNGVVSHIDTLAVTRNYSKTHSKNEGANRGKNTDPILKIDIQNDSLKAGDTLVAYILLGENALPAKDVYGIAFSLNYNKDYFSGVSVDYSGNWLGTNTLGYSNSTNGLDLALTKTDHNNSTGAGRIATVRMILSQEQQLDIKQLKLEIADNIVISADEQFIPTNVEDDSVKIYKKPNSIFATQKLQIAKVNIYPNPFSDQTTIEYTLDKTSKVSMSLNDISGKNYVLYAGKLTPAGKHQFQLDTKHFNLPAGVFILKIEIDGFPAYKRMVKVD